MTDYEMLEKLFRLELSDKFPQYETYLTHRPIRIIQAKRNYSGGRAGHTWYKKDDIMLGFGLPTSRMVWNKVTRQFDISKMFQEVFSAYHKGMCLAPVEHFKVIEIIK